MGFAVSYLQHVMSQLERILKCILLCTRRRLGIQCSVLDVRSLQNFEKFRYHSDISHVSIDPEFFLPGRGKSILFTAVPTQRIRSRLLRDRNYCIKSNSFGRTRTFNVMGILNAHVSGFDHLRNRNIPLLPKNLVQAL